MRTFIITDIHGCWHSTAACLDKAGFSPDTDSLICLGDTIDRGVEIFEAVMHIRELEKKMGERAVLLMGNHEEMLINSLEYPFHCANWLYGNGGQTTVDALHENGMEPSDLKDWCQGMHYYHETERYICVHAGLSDMEHEKTPSEILLWDRTIANEGWYSGKLLIHGHTPMYEAIYQDGFANLMILRPGIEYNLPNTGSINLDTGCVYGNKLTIMVIQDNRTFQIFQEAAN